MFALRRMRFRIDGVFERNILIENEVRIGSDKRFNNICIQLTTNDIDISLQHCIIESKKDINSLIIRDCDTDSGTFVNGVRLKSGESRALHEDDILCFGGPPIHETNKKINPVLFRVVRTEPAKSNEPDRPKCAFTKQHSDALSADTTCSICLDVFLEPVVLECDHVFCGDCAETWVGSSQSVQACPECRYPITMPPRRIRHMDSMIQKTVEPTLSHIEKKARSIRREVLWNKNRIRVKKQTPKVLRCSRDDIMSMLQQCIENTREAALLRSAVS